MATRAAVHTWSSTQPCAAGPCSGHAAGFSRQRGDRRQRDPLGPREARACAPPSRHSITGGENVYAPEVEEAILQHPAIRDAAVVGRPHQDWGETVVAVVEADSAVTLEELRRFLSTRLAKYKIPRELMVVPLLPRTPSGKVKKRMLRKQVQTGP